LAQAVKQKQADDMKIAKQNSDNNIAGQKASAQETGAQAMALDAQNHKNKLEQIQKEQDGKAMTADINTAGVLKGKIIDAVLSDPTATLDKIPAFIWQTLHITDTAQQQFILQSMQAAAQKQQQPMQPQGQPMPQQQGQGQQPQQAAA